MEVLPRALHCTDRVQTSTTAAGRPPHVDPPGFFLPEEYGVYAKSFVLESGLNFSQTQLPVHL